MGGQIATTSRIENYLGFPVGVSGEEFAERAYIQALRFGASIVLPAAATGLSGDSTAHVIHLDTGDHLTSRSLVRRSWPGSGPGSMPTPTRSSS